MADTFENIVLTSADYMALHAHLGEEANKLRGYERLQPILSKLSSLANEEVEIAGRIRVKRNELAELEQKLAAIPASIQTARENASREIAQIQKDTAQFKARYADERAAMCVEIDKERAAKQLELNALVEKIDNFKKTFAH